MIPLESSTNKDGMSGFQVNQKNKLVPRGCLTGHWEINFHGCWWEVSDIEWGHDNFWMKGDFPTIVDKKPEHGCSDIDIKWEVCNLGADPYFERNGAQTIWRNGYCKICKRQVRRVYKLIETYETKNHKPIEL